MHIRSLEHLLQAVLALVQPRELIVLGYSSLLASRPACGDPGQPVELTLDADLLPDPIDERLAGILHEAVGEGSLFHAQYGCYAEIMTPAIADTLPAGWRTRLVPLGGVPRVQCLDPVDLALTKLSVGRSKDIDFVASLLKLDLITPDALRQRFQTSGWPDDRLKQTALRMAALLNRPD